MPFFLTSSVDGESNDGENNAILQIWCAEKQVCCMAYFFFVLPVALSANIYWVPIVLGIVLSSVAKNNEGTIFVLTI